MWRAMLSMCIVGRRTSCLFTVIQAEICRPEVLRVRSDHVQQRHGRCEGKPVSYTHLTLPTTYEV